MKKISLIAILMCSLLFAITPAELKVRLNEQYKGLSSFEARVQQINYYTQLKQKIEYSGMFYHSPGRMLMHFTRPNVQRLEIKQGKVELYDAASHTLIKSSIQSQYAQLNPLEILQLYWDKSAVSIVAQDQDIAHLKLIPAKDPLIKEMLAKVNSKSGIIQSLKYSDPADNTVEYIFSSIKRNQGISASVWQFTYPKDTSVIEQ